MNAPPPAYGDAGNACVTTSTTAAPAAGNVTAATATRRLIIVVTAYLPDTSCLSRVEQYTQGVAALLSVAPSCAEIVMVEGNGCRATPLDSLGVRVVYTSSSLCSDSAAHSNVGYRELLDVRAALAAVKAQADDFVVKLTGRYVVRLASPFFEVVIRQALSRKVDAVARFGSFMTPLAADQVTDDCVTGLVGATAAVVMSVTLPTGGDLDCVEWHWARAMRALPRERVSALGLLGVGIRQGRSLVLVDL